MRTFVNTDEFRREAINFLKNGYYTDALPKTKDYYDYWDEQVKRCEEGYSVGGLRITGDHYFYLNFNQILLVPKEVTAAVDDVTGRRMSGTKIQSFPAFWDGDYEYFWALEIARNGITKEEYEQLGLEVQILDLRGGKHLVVLKSRGKGFSYKGGSMLTKRYQLGRRSKNYAIANEKGYLIEDGLLSKSWDTMAFLDANTPWKQPKLKDTELIKVCGFMHRTKAGYVPKGRRNSIIGVTLKNNPDKARGKRGELIFYEEAGKCPVLLKAWEINRPSVEQGAFAAGIMVAFGTGGTEKSDFTGLEELFFHPNVYNCIPFDNIWDEGGQGTTCGFFVPTYQNWEGFIDVEGNSDIEGAKAYHEEEREKKKQAKNTENYDQYVAENPFTPREATLQVSTNIFPKAELIAHQNSVKAHHRWKSVPYGILYENEYDKIVFRPQEEPKPIYQYPVRKGDDQTGAVCIVEAPYRINGQIPKDLYMICLDPYDKDKSTGPSIGAAYIIKMANNFSFTYNNSIVASYVGRPATIDDFNRNLFLLAQYYNAQIALESNRATSVIEYAKRYKLTHYLIPEPSIFQNKEMAKQGVKAYGLTMNEERKGVGEQYLRDWLLTPLVTYEDGQQMKILHTILDLGLLEELIKFSWDGNFDRVSSLLVGMFFMRELSRREIVPERKKTALSGFMNRKLYA